MSTELDAEEEGAVHVAYFTLVGLLLYEGLPFD